MAPKKRHINSGGNSPEPKSKRLQIPKPTQTKKNTQPQNPEKMETQPPEESLHADIPLPISDKAKPIIVSANYNVFKNIIINLKLEHKPLIKILNANQISLLCDAGDKATIIKKLEEQKIAFHTFTEKSSRKTAVVLKGFYYLSSAPMLEMLKNNGIAADSVSFISSSEERPIYLVHFRPGTTSIHQLKSEYRAIDSVIVRWENQDKDSKRHVQCGKCKRWGHTSANCGHTYRCIKCNGDHAPRECSRTTRENTAESRVYCVNCEGEHPANSTICPAFQRYVTKIKVRKPVARMAPQSRPAAVEDYDEFPEILSTQLHINQSTATSSLPRITPSQRATYAETIKQRFSKHQHVVSSPNPINEATQSPSEFLTKAIQTLTNHLECMLKSLNETFSTLCHQLQSLYGGT
jgi:hypothetical protein